MNRTLRASAFWGGMAVLLSLTSPALAQADENQTELVRAIGTLSGSHLYQTFLNLGLLDANVRAGTYSTAEGKQVLATVQSLVNTVEKRLVQVNRVPLAQEDRTTLIRVRQANELLRQQADKLAAYWNAPDEAAAEQAYSAYKQSRDEAWKSISRILQSSK